MNIPPVCPYKPKLNVALPEREAILGPMREHMEMLKVEKQAAALVKEAMLQSHATQRRIAEEQRYGLSVSPEKMREGKNARIKRLSAGGDFVGSLETEMPYTSRGLTEEYADYEQEGAHSPENITQVHPSNIFEYAQPASKARAPLVQESTQIERNGTKGPPPRHVLHQRQALTAERTVCVCVCVYVCVAYRCPDSVW
jgi:hypothetical protein